MSPERVRLESAPGAVRITDGASLQNLLDLHLSALEAQAHAAGRSAAAAEAEARVNRSLATLDEAVAALSAAQAAANAEIGRMAVKLGVGIARRILRHELPNRNYDIEAIVRETLARAGVGRGACVVHLHADDVAALAGHSFRSNTVLEADPDLARGDVQVQTPQGLLVRDIEELLLGIQESLMESLAE